MVTASTPMRMRISKVVIAVLVLSGIQGCIAVYYAGMPMVYDSVKVDDEHAYHDIPYAQFGESDPKGRLDLFLPDEGTNWPVLVFVHGGGWSSGDKALKFGGKEIYLNIGRYFASNGIATAVINYRLLPGVHWKTQIGDVAKATNWVFENIEAYGGDPNTLFLSGHSAGTQLVARVAIDPAILADYSVSPSDIRGVIAVSGAGLEMQDDLTNQSGKMMRYLEKRFGVVDKSGTWAEGASILSHISPDDPPFLIFVGGEEAPELLRQSTLLKETLDLNGVSNSMEVVSGRSHARMILLLSGNGNSLADSVETFIIDRATHPSN